MHSTRRIAVIDTHTGGEPTRVVLSGGPDLGTGTLIERRQRFAKRFDDYRTAIVNEPRGSAVMVGALVVPPVDPSAAAAVIFFNNVGYLGMCGHGAIGVAVALAHACRIGLGEHLLETPVGTVRFTLEPEGTVTLENVASYRWKNDVALTIPGHGMITGDVAWGGNWFFLCADHGQELDLSRVEELTDFTWRVRQALTTAGITGRDGAEIDHIELFGPPRDPRNQSRSFVLCPGKAYDRSPCGTGTSAKLACLAAAGKLASGELWRQESIVGSVFAASYRWAEADPQLPIGAGPPILPRLTGTAYVNAEATLLLDPCDPFQMGIRA